MPQDQLPTSYQPLMDSLMPIPRMWSSCHYESQLWLHKEFWDHGKICSYPIMIMLGC